MHDHDMTAVIGRLLALEKRVDKLEENAAVPPQAKKRGMVVSKSIIDHLVKLKSEGYFDQPHTVKEMVEVLAKGGYHYPPQSLTEPLQRAVRQGVLGRVKKDRIWAYCKR